MSITIIGCLILALVLGLLTQKLRLSPIVGYLITGIIVSPYTRGLIADIHTVNRFAEIGVILLMFDIGLNFHIKDLVSVKKIAIPGAIFQCFVSTLLGAVLFVLMGYPLLSGITVGIAISVASTVVMVRVLSDNDFLHTKTGHCAIGWLVVEDLFTIFMLVLIPIIFTNPDGHSIIKDLGLTTLKLMFIVFLTLSLGKKIFPWLLEYISKTKSSDLFTLMVLTISVGFAIFVSKFFALSMALGAFLAGLVVGQSEFGIRATSEVLPMRSVFSVLFFISIGMLFKPQSLSENFLLMLLLLLLVLIVKPLVATIFMIFMKQPLKESLLLGIVLAQIGEFSFILITLAKTLNILPESIVNVVIAVSIISITLSPLLFGLANSFINTFENENNP